ncbi:DoxX family protein [Trichocoleus sp. DQ-A3]|uniref:DoxX family protein n=1 Tax=Cyanophyceae TaxID=3028117 RepID=UPI0016821CC1|nr:DoxX family protein [Coleofasciculus sp. FACHB-125]MBD1902535.1 DoxX family protein [Coleofasciculus sp. FACHB-125]
MEKYIPLIARAFLAAIFLKSGFDKITGFSGTQQFMAKNGIPLALTGLLLVAAIILELAGGLSVVLGYKARWGAIALIIFIIPATLIFHTNFAANPMQINAFMKNLAIIGGLLMVYYIGSGPVSLDEQMASKRSD